MSKGNKRKFSELTKTVKNLLEKNESSSCVDNPLFKAIKNGHTEVAVFLLKQGANPDVKPDDSDNHDGMWFAVKNNDLVLMEALFEAGYKYTFLSWEGNTADTDPLYKAVEDNNLRAVEILIAHGCAPTAKNEKGNTALDKAASKGYLEIVKCIVLGAKNNKENASLESKKRCIDDSRENSQQPSENQKPVSHDNIKHIFLTDVHIFNQHGEEIELSGVDSNS